jgi:hypothetical protein
LPASIVETVISVSSLSNVNSETGEQPSGSLWQSVATTGMNASS